MSAPPLRRLFVDDAVYFCKTEHRHEPPEDVATPQGKPYRCRELFTAYLEGYRACPLRVWFDDSPGVGAGYPSSGIVEVDATGERYNLHAPRLWVALLREAVARGWRPATESHPFVVSDGLEFARKAVPPVSR